MMVLNRIKTFVFRPMMVVARIFLRTPITVIYPKKTPLIPDYIHPRSRGYHFLDLEKCVGCKMCERICPNACIEMVHREEPLPIEGIDSYEFNPKNKNKIFPQIWLGRCLFCGLCTTLEACRYDAMHHTPHIGEPLPAYDDLMIHTPELMYKMLYYYHDARKPAKKRKRKLS